MLYAFDDAGLHNEGSVVIGVMLRKLISSISRNHPHYECYHQYNYRYHLRQFHYAYLHPIMMLIISIIIIFTMP